MSSYRDALDSEAFGHFQTVPDRERRDEESLPLSFVERPDGPWYDMLARRWRVRFGGSDRFETFGLEDFDGANALYRRLAQERDVDLHRKD